MQQLRIFVVCVVAFGVLVLGDATAGAELPGITDVSVAVPMTCVGQTTETRTITVSATLPNRVRAGRAYTVTNLTTDVPNAGAVTITASDGHPTTFAAGSGGSSAVQLVAGTRPGGTITLQVTSAAYLVPGTITGVPRPILIPGVRIGCTPAAPVTLGSIKVVGQGSRPATDTANIDVTLGLETQIIGVPFTSNPVRITATVPTELHPGDTFTLPDLQVSVPFVPFTVQPSIVADGTEPSGVTAASVHTVTAQPGETVDLRLVRIDYDISVVASFPISSGHLASIPVTAP
jgi:hypothetical protein